MSKIDKVFEKFSEVALQLPETEEGSSCNKVAYKARKKAFLYLGEKDGSWNIMLKLTGSTDDVDDVATVAEELSINDKGWVSASFSEKQMVPKKVLAWVEESYRALVPKALVKLLDEQG